jgi:MFS-type transporter involved in bile tolerance (Atg22 family)
MDTFLLGTLPDADRSSAYAAYSAIVMLMSSVSSVVVGTLVEWGLPFDTLYRFFAAFLVVVLISMAVLQWVTSPRRGLLRE